MEKIKKKVVMTIVRKVSKHRIIDIVKKLKLPGGVSIHHKRPRVKRLYTTGPIRIRKNDTAVTCSVRESLQKLRMVIRKEYQKLCSKPPKMETFAVIITEDKEPFFA